MHYLYSESNAEDLIILDGDEARHASVLRLKKDEPVGILNGKGRLAIGLGDEGRKIYRINVHKIEHTSMPNFKVHVAIAPTKQIDRFEWFLEKATELGVHEITPLISDHGERNRLNTERLHKILIAAIKQSGRPWLPLLNVPITIESFIKKQESPTYLAHVSGQTIHSIKIDPNEKSVCIIIGPEGDFSDRELHQAKDLNIPFVSFGEYRLRTETAGIYAAAYFAHSNK